jgi:hypothetical protein
MLLAKCFVKYCDHRYVSHLVCIHLSPAIPPSLYLRGDFIFCWCIVEALNPGSAPVFQHMSMERKLPGRYYKQYNGGQQYSRMPNIMSGSVTSANELVSPHAIMSYPYTMSEPCNPLKSGLFISLAQ